MKAIFKRELHASAVTLFGAAAGAVILFILGFVTRTINIRSAYSSFGYTLYNAEIYTHMICVPLLTMRLFAEERRSRSDQLLITSPVSPLAVALGKYLALIVQFLLVIAVISVYPLILSRFGTMSLVMDYAAVFMYFLQGAAYLSIGMCISNLTENPVIAAIATLLFIAMTHLIGTLSRLAGGSRFAGLVFIIVLILLCCVILYLFTKRYYLSLCAAAVLCAGAFALFRFRGSFYANRISAIIGILDFRKGLYNTIYGTFSLRDVLFYLSYIVLGIVICVKTTESRMQKNGLYLASSAAVWTAVLIAANLVLGVVPDGLITKDISPQLLYSIGDTSKEVLTDLSEDVTLYFLTETGNEDENIGLLLDSYEAYSGHIHVRKVDVVDEPAFASQFTDETVRTNSVIAQSSRRSRVIPYADFYVTDYAAYYQTNTMQRYFDAEGLITSAIAYVSSDTVDRLYTLTGHGELTLSEMMTDAVKKENIELSSVNLLTGDIPDDCTMLAIYTPMTDITEEEAEKIRAYLAGGGHLFVTTAYLDTEMPVLDGLLAGYGLSRVDGYVLEGDTAYYTQVPYLLIPELSTSSPVTKDLKGQNVVYPFAQGISVEEVEGLSYRKVLVTSDKAFARTDTSTGSYEKTESDTDGPFVLAETAEDTSTGMKLILYTTPCVFSKEVLMQFLNASVTLPAGNTALFDATLAYLAERDTRISIPAKSTEIVALSITEKEGAVFGSIIMFVLPALVLAAGLIVYIRRRRRA